MKIIPISTKDLRTIVQWEISYSDLYSHFEQAFESSEKHPQKWYDEFVEVDNIFKHDSELPMAAEAEADYGN